MPKKKQLKPRMRCPKCHRDDLDVSEVNRDRKSMTEELVCNYCGHSWLEHYKLILEEIDDGEDE